MLEKKIQAFTTVVACKIDLLLLKCLSCYLLYCNQFLQILFYRNMLCYYWKFYIYFMRGRINLCMGMKHQLIFSCYLCIYAYMWVQCAICGWGTGRPQGLLFPELIGMLIIFLCVGSVCLCACGKIHNLSEQATYDRGSLVLLAVLHWLSHGETQEFLCLRMIYSTTRQSFNLSHEFESK